MSSTQSTPRTIAWVMWSIGSIFYAYQYILRVMPNIMLGDIMDHFHISAATFGQFSGVYYLGYSLMHLPIGIMLDRFGPKRVMTGSILLSVIGLLPLIFAEYWVWPIVGRVLIGMGSSAAILGVFKIIRMAFREERFSRMLSLAVTIGLVGAIYGGGPVSFMREAFGYQTVVKLFALGGLILAAATYFIVPKMEAKRETTVFSDIKQVFSNKKVVWSCIFAGLMVGPLEGFADVWGTAFLQQVYGFEGALAASLPSMIFIGMCFGAPVLSLIAEKIGNLRATVGAGLVMAAAFFALLTCQMSSALISFSFVVVGVSCAYQILAIYKASTYVDESVAGLTTAVANMIIMTFGYFFHAIIGSIVNALGGPTMSQALVYGMIVIPVALCVGSGGFFYFFLKEKKLKIASASK